MSLIKAWPLLGTIRGSEISLWGHFLPPLSLSQNGISQVYDSLRSNKGKKEWNKKDKQWFYFNKGS